LRPEVHDQEDPLLRAALTAAALAGGLATLALSAPAGAQGSAQVTTQQLKINQRIAAAAVKRSNGALVRVEVLETRVRALENLNRPPIDGGKQIVTGPGLANDVPPPRILAPVEVAAGQTGVAEATCPAPFQLGHGGYVLPATAQGLVYESAPLRTAAGWRAAFRNEGTAAVTLTAYAACATP
jgi:hypothetical protein